MREKSKFSTVNRGRFERWNVVVSILIAGWVPSILMLGISYAILTHTLESKILRDRQAFVKLIAHLVGDDLGRTGAVVDYYQASQELREILKVSAETEGQKWVAETFYSHPRIDGMFLTDANGLLVAAIPPEPSLIGSDYGSANWLPGARAANGIYVSPVHPRSVDRRNATNVVGTVRAEDGTTLGYVGVSVLVERIGRRLSAIDFADHARCQIFDQDGNALFSENFRANTKPVSGANKTLSAIVRSDKTGHMEREGNIYAFSPVEFTGWITVVDQPSAIAYAPVRDLLGKTTFLALWLIIGTAIIAWLASRVYRRQSEAAARIDREVTFNDKILANMPSGIALVDPESRRFLQANDAFGQMARRLGNLPPEKEISDATYQDVELAPRTAIEKVLEFGTPYQLIEQPLLDHDGATNFVNINLLRLQDSKATVQGVLYLVEDKTRDVRLRQELISANASKDQFLALLSHELRNPLSPVITMVAELEALTPDGPEVRQALAVIRRNVELEARLIDDLLDVTRIAKGKLQLSLEVVSVHETLQRSYEICREDILGKNLEFEFRFGAKREFVNGDPARLQQVFWNLIKNAVKFTPEGGRIVVQTANPTDEEIEIRTIDNGIGIEPGKIDKVFNAFEQGQSSITRKFGGLGLGLAISKAMVQAHGGMIAVESEGTDKGSVFRIALKTVAAPIGKKHVPQTALPMQPNPSNGPARKTHLLVVDDHHDTCLGMKMLLERRGYRITVAHTADQAVEKAQEEEFDLLISDIGLPDRSGYELMEELRATRSLRGIALSGFGMENDINKAHAAGFAEHLTKPINFDRLDQAIRSLLAAT